MELTVSFGQRRLETGQLSKVLYQGESLTVTVVGRKLAETKNVMDILFLKGVQSV